MQLAYQLPSLTTTMPKALYAFSTNVDDDLKDCHSQDLDEDDSGVLEPFQKMLQFALEPLLLYVDPVADQPGQICMLHDTSTATCEYGGLNRTTHTLPALISRERDCQKSVKACAVQGVVLSTCYEESCVASAKCLAFDMLKVAALAVTR